MYDIDFLKLPLLYSPVYLESSLNLKSTRYRLSYPSNYQIYSSNFNIHYTGRLLRTSSPGTCSYDPFSFFGLRFSAQEVRTGTAARLQRRRTHCLLASLLVLVPVATTSS